MSKLTTAKAWCNNEVAYLAWKTEGKIDGGLGFMITRIHLDDQGNEVERRILPAWVAFKTETRVFESHQSQYSESPAFLVPQ